MLSKMKKQTTTSANQAETSTLEMWLNSENKLFTNLFAEKGESITNRKMLLDLQLIMSIAVLVSFTFVNPIMTLIGLGWFASSVMLVRQQEDMDKKGGSK